MNKRFIEKLQQSDRVLRYLYQHACASTDELCAAGGCTQRTLLRIVSDVREMCGADIRWDTKKQRYAMINRHEFSPPAEPLDEQAIIRLIYDHFLPHPQPGTASAARRDGVPRVWCRAEELGL